MIRATLLALAALTGAAFAAEPVDGAWTFTTEHYRVHEEDGARTYTVVRGKLLVQPAKQESGAQACTMSTEQFVYGQTKAEKPVVLKTYTSEQTCTLTQSKDGKVIIVGDIVTASSPGYRADDFTLTIESSSRMTGQMHSRWTDNLPVAKATFYRGSGEVS